MDANALSVHNLPFFEALYEAYERDPNSVDPKWLPILFNGSSAPTVLTAAERLTAWTPTLAGDAEQIALQTEVDKLIEAHRLHGHHGAKIDPLARPRRADVRELDPGFYGLGPDHLDREFLTSGLIPEDQKLPLREIIDRLRKTYCRHIGVEYWHLADPVQRAWLQARMEGCLNEVVPAPDEQIRLLRSLINVDTVDRFLHSKFLGAKRFSIAGAESIIPLLDCLIESAADHSIGEVMFGMAHRGRLNVLMNILGKSPQEVFSEFSNTDAESYIGSGDVKYHLGYHRYHTTASGKDIYLALAFNPSHLEAITPVIQGRSRARQDLNPGTGPRQGFAASLGVTLHGDAAFAGQGVVAETLNMAGLEGYTTGGMIRVVINNQIGFTTEPREARSGLYATDVAQILGVPVFHVNGDDPEAAAYVAQLAVEWRERFHRDIVIDVICYRQFGHNEGDDPTFTQPKMYELIKNHASVRDLYQRRLIERGTVSDADCQAIVQEFEDQLDRALDAARSSDPKRAFSPMHGVWQDYCGGPEDKVDDVDTRLDAPTLAVLGERMTAVPEGFNIHRKLVRLLEDSRKMSRGEAPINWATAELLAYASLLREGAPVRISGQDSRRGTFSHRHAVFTDTETGLRHCPLEHIGEGNFSIYNSPLSEFSVLGFEFGYSLATPQGLLIWEAQFGDFVNSAQVIIDQFISSSEDKWNRICGLTLMLPHGYEGQGPEHSSARLERFLQQCAEDNMTVVNLTTPAQLFHALRRQVVRKWRKPMIMMSPKSLLRFRPSFSPITEFSQSGFSRVIDDREADPDKVELLLLSAGKVFYDLDEHRRTNERDDVALIRVEQLYPFVRTAEAIEAAIARYPNAKRLRWVQEEPENMGAWGFMFPRLHKLVGPRFEIGYAGRVESASPATGSPEAHKLELARLLADAYE